MLPIPSQAVQHTIINQNQLGIKHAILSNSNSIEHEMLFHWLRDIPCAAHTCRKCHKVSLAKSCWHSTIRGSNCYLAFHKITGFCRIIGPRELAYVATPRAPVENTFLFQEFVVWLRDDLNLGSSGGRGAHCEGTATVGSRNRRLGSKCGNSRSTYQNAGCQECLHCYASESRWASYYAVNLATNWFCRKISIYYIVVDRSLFFEMILENMKTFLLDDLVLQTSSERIFLKIRTSQKFVE